MIEIETSFDIIENGLIKEPFRLIVYKKREFLEAILQEYNDVPVKLSYDHDHNSFHLQSINTTDALTKLRIGDIIRQKGKLLSYSHE